MGRTAARIRDRCFVSILLLDSSEVEGGEESVTDRSRCEPACSRPGATSVISVSIANKGECEHSAIDLICAHRHNLRLGTFFGSGSESARTKFRTNSATGAKVELQIHSKARR
jgi:hypothetical protein